MELICIVCPRSCRITVNGDEITGFSCKRGQAFAKSEMTAPMRSVTTTVATVFPDYPVLPVRTDGEIPKKDIGALMELVKCLCVDKKLKCGDIVAEKILGLDVNLIATGTVFTEY
jgi:CxxC motif-containing protein